MGPSSMKLQSRRNIFFSEIPIHENAAWRTIREIIGAPLDAGAVRRVERSTAGSQGVTCVRQDAILDHPHSHLQYGRSIRSVHE